MRTAQCAGSVPAAAAAWTRAILHPGLSRWLTLPVHIPHPAALSSLMWPHPLLGECELLGVRVAALRCLPAIEHHRGNCWGVYCCHWPCDPPTEVTETWNDQGNKRLWLVWLLVAKDVKMSAWKRWTFTTPRVLASKVMQYCGKSEHQTNLLKRAMFSVTFFCLRLMLGWRIRWQNSPLLIWQMNQGWSLVQTTNKYKLDSCNLIKK